MKRKHFHIFKRNSSPRTYIYALTDPSGDVRYVGKANNPKERYKNHYYGCHHLPQNKKRAWLSSLKASGQKPGLIILEECAQGDSRNRERYWVEFYKNAGAKLTNTAKV